MGPTARHKEKLAAMDEVIQALRSELDAVNTFDAVARMALAALDGNAHAAQYFVCEYFGMRCLARALSRSTRFKYQKMCREANLWGLADEIMGH